MNGYFARNINSQNKKGIKLVDWGRIFADAALFIDAKRSFLLPSSLCRLDDRDWSSFNKSFIKGLEQIGAFVREFKKTNPHIMDHKESIGVIVTQSDSTLVAHWDTLLKQAAEKSQEHKTTFILLSLNQFHALTTNWLVSGETEWLPNALRQLAANGRGFIHKIAPPRKAGSLWDALNNLVSRFGADRPGV